MPSRRVLLLFQPAWVEAKKDSGMKKKEQCETLSRNYDELEEEKKEILLKIGEKLLGIQDLAKCECKKKEKSES